MYLTSVIVLQDLAKGTLKVLYFQQFIAILLIAWCALIPTAIASEPDGEQTDTAEQKKDWLDGLQGGVENTVDNTARWFDRFFGDGTTSIDDYNAQGRLTIAPQWSAYEGWKVDSSFRAQFRLPQAKQRFSAIIGRGNFDDIVNDRQTNYRGSVIDPNAHDEEWIIGLGFNPKHGETDRLYFSAGIRGGLKADLYAQARHMWQRRVSDFSQLRLRTSLFWRDSDGFGINERIDWEASMRQTWLARTSLDLTYAERTKGVRWHHRTAIYHLYAKEKAIASEVYIFGETEHEVTVHDVGIRFIHRQEWLREWLFLELWGGFHWPREELHEARERSWMFGIEFAMWYGD